MWTETGSRRDSGTAYTTKELADEIVERTLAPLCYSPGPQDTSDTSQWRIRPIDRKSSTSRSVTLLSDPVPSLSPLVATWQIGSSKPGGQKAILGLPMSLPQRTTRTGSMSWSTPVALSRSAAATAWTATPWPWR